MKKKTKTKATKSKIHHKHHRTHNAYFMGVDISRHPAVFAGVGILLITGFTLILMGLTN